MSADLRGRTVTRRLVPADAEAYRTLWLIALRDHPAAFSAAYEEDAPLPVASYAKRIDTAEIFGAFDTHSLLGFVTLQRSPLLKRRHVGHIAGMYVAADSRGSGVADILLRDVLAHAAEHVDQVELFVACDNPRARRFYQHFGFEPYGLMRRALRVEHVDYDADMMVRVFR